jgi:hypothetical protein
MDTVDWRDERPDEDSEPATPQGRQAWESPSIQLIGTVADLVRTPKKSGDQDCGGRKRFDPGSPCA